MLYLITTNNKAAKVMRIMSHIKKYGEKRLSLIIINLNILKNLINSPRAKHLSAVLYDHKGKLLENVEVSMSVACEIERDSKGSLSNYVRESFVCSGGNDVTTVAILLEDLSPLATNTLSRMAFDLSKLLINKSGYRVKIIVSKLHTIDHTFWLPCAHQTRKLPDEHYFKIFGIDENGVKPEIIYLNELFYAEKEIKEQVDCVITYPFRHGHEHGSFFNALPTIEVEILSGMSKGGAFDILIPNGVPSIGVLKERFSQIALVIPPRYPFSINGSSHIVSVPKDKKVIASVCKSFELRTEFDRDAFFDPVFDFLSRHDEYYWVVVGASEQYNMEMMSKYQKKYNKNNLFMVSYESNLPSLFRECFLYIHPPVIGGGRSPAIAFENSCPALTFDFGDCTKYVPNNFKFESIGNILSEVIKLSENDSYYRMACKLGLEVVAGTVNDESAIGYDAAIKRARVKGLVRINKAN